MKHLLSGVAIIAALAVAVPASAQRTGPGPYANTGTGPGVTPPGGRAPPLRSSICRRGLLACPVRRLGERSPRRRRSPYRHVRCRLRSRRNYPEHQASLDRTPGATPVCPALLPASREEIQRLREKRVI
jgi:hypothetical protein